MRKLFLLLLSSFIITSICYGQSEITILRVPTASTTWKKQYGAGTLVYCQSNRTWYETKITLPSTTTVTSMLGDTSKFAYCKAMVGIDTAYIAFTNQANTFSRSNIFSDKVYVDDSISLPQTGYIKLGEHELSRNNSYYLELNNGLIINGYFLTNDETFIRGELKHDTIVMIKNKYYTSPYYISWAVKDTVGKENKIRLQNLSDVNIQNKAGNGQIEVLERDTTGTDAKINLKAVKLATADSSHMNRVVVSDTLQGVVLFTSEGARYRLRVSPTGVLTAVVVP